jgi:AraC-like DNA-binding protein
MRVIALSDLYRTDFSVLRIVPFYHRWSENACFTTPEGGRPNSGLMFFIDCETEYQIEDRAPFFARRRQISYVPQGGRYQCRFLHCGDPTQHSNEYLINFELFDDSGQPFVLSESVQIIQPHDSAWTCRQFEEVLHQFHHSGAPSGRVKALVYNILMDLALEQRREHLAVGRYGRIYPGLLQIEQHYTRDLTVPELAQICHLSETGFRRLFHACTGDSPLTYIIRLRLDKARLLLESGALSVAEVAFAVGFQDPSYFSRLFKQKTGVLPVTFLGRRC